MVIIPASHKTIYNETINALIDSVYGVDCIMNMPYVKTECPNCYLNTMSNVSSNTYKSGGPVPFDNGQICPYCTGVGYSDNQLSSVVRMLVYWDANAWAKDNKIAIQFVGGTIITKGKMANFETIATCDSMDLHNNLVGVSSFKYRKAGDPTPFGIGKDSFFVCPWVRV